MGAEVYIVHRYPDAERFLLRLHGATALAVLHDLLRQAELVDGHLVVTTSVRAVAARVGCVSKDTAHRAVHHLVRTGILETVTPLRPAFRPGSYRVHLDGTGIERRPAPHDAG